MNADKVVLTLVDGSKVDVDYSGTIEKIEVTNDDGVTTTVFPTTTPGETPTIEVPLDTPLILKAK